MKVLLLAFLVSAPFSLMAKDVVVFADIALLQDFGYAHLKESGCDETNKPGDLVAVCIGGWSRYRLSAVSRLDRVRLKDTIALIYADPELNGRWRLVLHRLDASAATMYGASYKVVSADPAKENSGL